MLKRTLVICALTVFGVMGLQAMEQELPPSNLVEQNSEENQNIFANEESKKDLTPGVLVCNSKEDKCLKEENQGESSSSILFSVFCGDHEDEIQLLACKDCR